MELFWGEEDGISPVIGVVLMVAITVALAAVAAIVFTSSGSQLHEGNANAKVSFNAHPAGLEMKIENIATSAEVELNGDTYTTIDEDDAGKTVVLPTANGDSIVVKSGNDESSVLVTKQIDEKSEEGDFIARYNMKNSNDDTSVLNDITSSGNDAPVDQAEFEFSGDKATLDPDSVTSGGDSYEISSLNAPTDTNELTIMVRFKIPKSNHIDDNCCPMMFEHEDPVGSHNNEIYVYTSGQPSTNSDEFRIKGTADDNYVDYSGLKYGKWYTVAISSEEGGETIMHVPGEFTETTSGMSSLDIGYFQIGSNAQDASNWKGKMDELRIYYTAMDKGEIQEAAASMDG